MADLPAAGLTTSLVEMDTPAQREAFAREVADVNRRRLRVIGPIMVLVHVVHAWVFWIASGERGTLNDATIRALDTFVIIHCAMVVITGALTVLVFRMPRGIVPRLMGPVVATLYLTHGALCTAVGLVATQSVSTYVGYCLGMAVILLISPRTAVIAYLLGLATLIGSI